MKDNKCFCPLYNALIDRGLCVKICNNEINDFRIKNISNYKTICLNCKHHNKEDLGKTLDFSELQKDLIRLKEERNDR